MSKFNQKGVTSARNAGPVSPMTTTGTTKTHEGGAGFTRDAKSELYLTAVTNMVGEDTFYESAKSRDDRFVRLIHQVAIEDPAWLYRFLGWLRNKANMRSASIVVAAEAIKARLDAGVHGTFEVARDHIGDHITVGSKDFIPQGMARADEPGEFLAYWISKYGKNLPKPVKRGVALAANDLYNEYAYSKYGKSDGSAFQMADVIELVHPSPKAEWQGDLYKYAIDMRHGREELVPATLPMLQHRDALMAMPKDERRAFLAKPEAAEELKRAGLTWEALSGWIGGELDAKFWESIIPTMGYMALLRNLRNFEKAGISRTVRKYVQERLSDPEQVSKSRQFPFRFLSAYRAVQSDWWGEALSDALDASVGNLPVFPGRTLVLVDTSASMNSRISQKSSVTHAEIGALFGVALANSGGAEADLYGFAGSGGYGWGSRYSSKVSFKHDLPKGGSVLKGIESFTKRIGEVGHGTMMVEALKETYNGHDRVILVTDMQAFAAYGGEKVTSAVPADVRMYGINPSGYSSTALDLSKRNRYEVGGFSDAVFRMISLIEAGNANWPF